MYRLVALILVLSLFSLGVSGCAEKSSTIEETKVTTPGGTTTVTTEKEVTKSGDNPPSVQP